MPRDAKDLVAAAIGDRSLLLNYVVVLFPSSGLRGAERIHFGRLNTNDGLSQNSVNTISQDRDGFLWLGTQDGLNRYNGYEFEVFRHDFADSLSLSDNYIWCVAHSRRGDIWVGTLHGGLSKYDRETGKFKSFQHVEGDSTSLPADDATCLVEDRKGTLWVGT